jgi:endonuclease/exonuclease/phosphatase family metal-dependent hydrolase
LRDERKRIEVVMRACRAILCGILHVSLVIAWVVSVTGQQGSITFLSQNVQLLPGILATAPRQRVPAIMDLIQDYNIVGLQEVFSESCQNKIVRNWHTRNALPTTWRIDLDKDVLAQKSRLPAGAAATPVGGQSASSDTGPTNVPMSFRLLAASPNNLPVDIVYDRHFVMGPDLDRNVDIPVLGLLGIDRQDGGLLILTNKEYPIIGASGFIFSENAFFRPHSNWDATSNKGCIYARVKLGLSEDGDEYIHVFTTHLQAHTCAECPTVRQSQLDELRLFIHNATADDNGNYDGYPIVLLGDFNVIAASSEYDSAIARFLEVPSFLMESGTPALVDAWASIKGAASGHTWIGCNQVTTHESPWSYLGNSLADQTGGGQRLDYVFYSAGSKGHAIRPISIDCVPSGARKTRVMYCFDDVGVAPTGCSLASGSGREFAFEEHDDDYSHSLSEEDRRRIEAVDVTPPIQLGNLAEIRRFTWSYWRTWWRIDGRETVFLTKTDNGIYQIYREKGRELLRGGQFAIRPSYYFEGEWNGLNQALASLRSRVNWDAESDETRATLSSNVTTRELTDNRWLVIDNENRGSHNVYVLVRTGGRLAVGEYVCETRSYTVSDHLGIAMLVALVAPPPPPPPPPRGAGGRPASWTP